MIPVVTVAEMRAIDAAAPESTDVLVERAGAAVAGAALRMLGGSYGRRVAVVVGKGNNGADGRSAARRLATRGVRIETIDAAHPPVTIRGVDLVIDAAYGTGFRGDYLAPEPGGAPVLAVDIPSGVCGDDGTACPGAALADATVTFAALKPGLLLGDGAARAGSITVAAIGLDTTSAGIHLVEDLDVPARLPVPPRDAHKWRSAVVVVAGSPGMTGAAELSAGGAMRAGAGMVRLGVPGGDVGRLSCREAVGVELPATDWASGALAALDRAKALVIGPGLGRSASTGAAVRDVLARSSVPTVVDADGIVALGSSGEAGALLRQRGAPTVLTPHEGEFERLTGSAPDVDRVGCVRRAADATGAVVLLKGPVTVVAEPGGRTRLVASGGPVLATAGTGDVLSGVIAAFLARGVPALDAAALAAHVHGAAAERGHRWGLVAGDLPDLVAAHLSSSTSPAPAAEIARART